MRECLVLRKRRPSEARLQHKSAGISEQAVTGWWGYGNGQAGPGYQRAARTFYCYGCQCEQPMSEKVRVNNGRAVRCRGCLARAQQARWKNKEEVPPVRGTRLYFNGGDVPNRVLECYEESLHDIED
jgi:hypothetical protein